ncbi:MAG: 1-acyl-sn-glycerol-3-phosphate acyltransferase [Bacteroidia bacterium]|nr:1-acyl-sn-glycerol-3-phosphate acyltransferase [Bacteroidia bacterium]
MLKASKTFSPLYENITDWPIARLSRNREAFVQELINMTYSYYSSLSTSELKDILSKTIFLERSRVAEEPWKVDPPKESMYWSKMKNAMFKLSQDLDDEAHKNFYLNKIREIISSYSEEIVGTFQPSTFRKGRRILTAIFNRLLNAAANKKFRRLIGTKYRVQDRLKVYGPIDQIRQLFSKGTVVIVPTHLSNIDSVMVGYAMDSIMGLPSFSYGAGLNLYNSGAAAYFMNRMGAYRVDRRKKNDIYLQTLKNFSQLSIEHGVNSLFFPGGTRSRSGEIETQLKMGLLGTAVAAQRALFQKGRSEKVFIVPLNTSYHFVLEAKYLIDQHLRKSGKEKYFISRDQSYSIRKSLKFMWELFSNTSEIHLSFGKPMDVLGYDVDTEGRSRKTGFGKIELKEYFLQDGQLVQDQQRDQVYTRKLASKIVSKYHSENIILSSHLMAFSLFHMIRSQHSELVIYDFLRLNPADYEFSFDEVKTWVELLRTELLAMEKMGEILVTNSVAAMEIKSLIYQGIRSLGAYHDKRPIRVTKKTNRIISDNLSLLLFYSNRLANYGLESIFYSKLRNVAAEEDAKVVTI